MDINKVILKIPTSGPLKKRINDHASVGKSSEKNCLHISENEKGEE